jgi:TetR/AcrR family transcriptional repressor of nem operon
MARPREFEPSEALNQAMQLFWQKGYQDTSMEDLVQATGVSRYGFYNEFGDKHDLFLKAIDHYANTNINITLSPLETTDASLPEIHAYFDNLSHTLNEGQEANGCLIGNTSMELAEPDEPLANLIDAHYTRMHAAFRNALQHAAQRGEIAADADVVGYADFLVGVANGYLACLRTTMSKEAIQRYLKVALERLV